MKAFWPAPLLFTVLLGACDASVEESRTPTGRALLTPATAIPPGTAPRGTAEYLAALAPPGPPSTLAALKRGRESYQVFCTPCHGLAGYGDGAVTDHGFPSPPSLHEDRLLDIEPSGIVTVVSDGKGRMLPMAERIPPAERWAIAYYIKALQLSQLPPGAGGRQNGVRSP